MSFFEKIAVILLVTVIVVINIFIFVIIKKGGLSDKGNVIGGEEKNISEKVNVVNDVFKGEYEVYQNDKIVKTFSDYNEALTFAKKYENASIKRIGGSTLWDNTPLYNVYKAQSEEFKAFSSFAQALDYAKSIGESNIYYRKSKSFVWNNYETRRSYHMIESVPRINQNPELNRGCEVTSLAMLLNFKGISVDKMALAQAVAKDPTPYTVIGSQIYYGNPDSGFVGDIYNLNNKGLGVYHKPIFELLKAYIGDKALDITGCSREDVTFYIGKNIPVWVIVNTKFKPLPPSEFVTWQSAEGAVYTTYSEHSVLLIGYDDKYIYFNDPMDASSVKKENKNTFFDAWEQMGRQGVTLCP